MVERINLKKVKCDLAAQVHEAESSDLQTDIESAIFQLEMVHIELDKLNDKENEEIVMVEQKFKKLRQHYYVKRNEITDMIPDFWSTVFTSHPGICNILCEEEEDCMRFLQRLEVETPENIKAGYSIKLYFNENPYFKNDVLIKEFAFKQGNLLSISTKIDWKKQNPISLCKESVKNGRKRSHNGHNSFFGWFANNDDASGDVIAEIIKDDIWPNSLHYYLVPDPDMEAHDKDEDSSDSSSDFDDDELFGEIEKNQRNNTGEGSSTK